MSAMTALINHNTNQRGLECCDALSLSEMGQIRPWHPLALDGG
jgi:hypothetical protein